ncbi:MAG: hypothetical protein P8J37_08190 [Fuerstiella sp.]|nr:hypothetical protein [Fuerstiella sp.]
MSPKIKRHSLLLAGLTASPSILLAGDLFARRKLRSRCCLPAYDYQTHRFTDPGTAGSLTAMAYLIDGSPITGQSAISGSNLEVFKTFQIDRSHVENDHCRIAQVTVTISSTGHWIMHMLATQHPGNIADAQQRPQFERFKRNLFKVDARPTGLMTLNRTESLAVIGKPEFPTIPVQEFWIQKEETQRIQRKGYSSELGRYFRVIEQVEIHFSYR